MDEVKNQIKNCCLEKEDPACTSRCPFHLDVREFISRVQRSGFNAAYRLYANTVGFPSIVSAICGASCKSGCPRGEVDAPVALDLIERTTVALASNTKPNCYNMPDRKISIAIVGAGMSGLACALRLCNKKYDVTIFEKSGRIGGSLWGVLEPEVFLGDIERQFQFEEYGLRLNTEVSDIDELMNTYAAVYVATGAGGNSFGLAPESADGVPFASRRRGVFLGGALMGADAAEAIAQGLSAAVVIENFIKTDNMKSAEPSVPTRIKLAADAIVPTEPVLPQNRLYTKDEAAREAKRCVKCRCDACRRHCGLMTYFQKFPKRIEEEVHITIYPGTLDGNGTVATRLLSTCNQCGLCKEVCPEDIDVGLFMRESHKAMRDKNAMPWVFHEFWLRDMEFANSERASMYYRPRDISAAKYMFFPGCQLGASNPDYVLKSYEYLLEKCPDTALLLQCCGAPAVWSGDEALHRDVCDMISEKWHNAGEPVMVFACASCRQMFTESLPEIKGVMLYDLMSEFGVVPAAAAGGEKVSVFDPCSSRHLPESQQSVREIVKCAGYELEPLSYEGRMAQCCSWGGQISIANPPYAKWLTEKRMHDADTPYVVYCSNCRDIFAESGKPVRHILDIVFGLGGWDRTPPTFSERRHSRERLKAALEARYLDKKSEVRTDVDKLKISPELAQKMHRDKILDEDMLAVIEFCESTGRRLLDPATGCFVGYCEIGHMTYWAEYTLCGEGYELRNAYGHRMKIELEEVWNGRKQKHDVREV